ncbi:hypothetical protein FOL47_010102 [Perkinsus chesapeaki]|uniref:Uncharacterized protein n=1 Tax=Perkinsus chesapeaki TaxID=330153 RepID=A0A7J6L4S4_PERCH|nr:hypothetical protein FOL47_010102 [Perkinsus chesapeaki]
MKTPMPAIAKAEAVSEVGETLSEKNGPPDEFKAKVLDAINVLSPDDLPRKPPSGRPKDVKQGNWVVKVPHVEAYVYSDFVLYISTPRIGPKSSGLVTGFALFVDGVISFLLGLAVYKGYFTIKAVLVFGIISLILALSYSIVLSAAAVTDNVGPDGWVYLGTLNFIKSVDEDGIDDWAQVNKVEIYHYLIVALSIILTGMGLMPFKAHLPSAVHQIYQPTP